MLKFTDMTMLNDTLTLNEVLNHLMFQKRIRVASLARITGVSQPTLQRMVSGSSNNPHQKSLDAIAKYFEVTIEQLKGSQPIPWLYPSTTQEAEWTKVPMLSFEVLNGGCDLRTAVNSVSDHVLMESKLSHHAFALQMNDASMEPIFPKDTVLIIDPDKPAKDRSFVVVYLKKHSQTVFRQLLIDGHEKYLKPTSPDFGHYKMNLLDQDDKIVGTLVQARRDYEN
jgi:SOS-response transcriptional repressor LexA